MEKYPTVLLKDPLPLVFILGNVDNEPDIHSRMIYSLRLALEDMDLEASSPSIVFKSLNLDYTFKEKKPSREFPSFDGILKANWLSKHTEQLPSTVLYLTSFSVDWNPQEWTRQEMIIQEKYMRYKNILISRDCRLILILVKVGAGSLEKDIVEERLSSLRKHLQFIDSKSFFYISNHDLSNQPSTSIKKISKSIREFTTAYYTSQCKRIRNLEKAMAANRTSLDMVLIARYNFKLGIFYEFLGQKSISLKCYRTSYDSCVNAIEILDEEWTNQIEAVAEYDHFKICSILLQPSAVKDASSQFKTHITKFLKAYSLPWRHFTWLAEQYIIFAQLLDQYKITDSYIDADRSFYYLNAAKYLSKRQNVMDNVDTVISPRVIHDRRQKLLAIAGKVISSS